MHELGEIEAIKRLKYRYFRFLDRKEWDAMRDLFTEDAVTSYDEGKYAFEGREKILDFLRGALGRPTVLTLHQGHHPEIELTGPDTATGIWYLEDRVIDLERQTELHGAAFYRDEYAKVDGQWRIRSTGYQRTFEQLRDRSETPSLRVTNTMFSAG